MNKLNMHKLMFCRLNLNETKLVKSSKFYKFLIYDESFALGGGCHVEMAVEANSIS